MQKPDIQEFSNFIIDYVSAMVSIGTYSSRINRCAIRIAQSYGYTLNLNFSFNRTIINIIDPDDYSSLRTYIVKNKFLLIDFTLISNLSALSWAIYDHIHDIKVAKRCFKKLISTKKRPMYSYVLIQSIGSAAFSRLFGGDFATLFLIFFSTLVGASLKMLGMKFNVGIRILYLCCSFISSYIAYIGVSFNLTSTPEVALGSSILYLIPGVFFINSVIDILKDYIQVGLSKIINIIILIICIALGLYLTLILSDFRLVQ
ncbi:MAG TPA: threonine/serine exporter family protein [Campylobacter avium]|uniref:threonine/serine ThrE exporter family protein n=1 Tax=Campylobacter avium TaxID=522485 RepID=UPI001E129EF9|nr:threonine/serine exporter family protein [Campylobacter avium]HJE65466.1 threonine/serine exporter family protein [Campylobacter avium]